MAYKQIKHTLSDMQQIEMINAAGPPQGPHARLMRECWAIWAALHTAHWPHAPNVAVGLAPQSPCWGPRNRQVKHDQNVGMTLLSIYIYNLYIYMHASVYMYIYIYTSACIHLVHIVTWKERGREQEKNKREQRKEYIRGGPPLQALQAGDFRTSFPAHSQISRTFQNQIQLTHRNRSTQHHQQSLFPRFALQCLTNPQFFPLPGN